jgi:hypothetical protein
MQRLRKMWAKPDKKVLVTGPDPSSTAGGQEGLELRRYCSEDKNTSDARCQKNGSETSETREKKKAAVLRWCLNTDDASNKIPTCDIEGNPCWSQATSDCGECTQTIDDEWQCMAPCKSKLMARCNRWGMKVETQPGQVTKGKHREPYCKQHMEFAEL